MKTKTKIELTIGYVILALIPITLLFHSCNRSNHLYTGKMVNTTCYGCNANIVQIGSHEGYSVGDVVIVDETNFVDMNDENGTQYIITKDLGKIAIQ